jgi:transcriptional regulator with XRE-family HTH domain
MSPRPDNIEITGTDLPARLTRLREARRLTKSELARLAQVSYRTVHELESGRRNRIQEKTLVLLAGALGVEPEELTHQARLLSGVPAPTARSGPSLTGRFRLGMPSSGTNCGATLAQVPSRSAKCPRGRTGSCSR